MKCPACNETLLMSERNGIEIDYCPNCRGVWLDRGELDKIIERSAVPAAPKAGYEKDYGREEQRSYGHDQHKRPYHKKKDSFLGDLFDF
ncbi:zf-TFIIB domain-containing protein [Pedobacter sp. SYP-B3415]|uniref:TFIIB-type zinc ribbon-containing protein n=1 Tax=Pedobacter sp. SYP-B3415 TaxID=2496641 RepID=UPI00101C2CB9|nr:zf-TFIIB domain-containing protein [Pedobacter sp. SYP-B3415]